MLGRVRLLSLVVLTLLSFAPIISAFGSGELARLLGCRLDEGSVHACRVAGVDIGEALYSAFVLGWLMLVTWPGMLASLALWVLLGVRLLWRCHRARVASRGPIV